MVLQSMVHVRGRRVQESSPWQHGFSSRASCRLAGLWKLAGSRSASNTVPSSPQLKFRDLLRGEAMNREA